MNRSRRLGSAWLPWLFILVMLGSIFWLLQRLNNELTEMQTCREQLENVYQVLALYEREHGRLPSLEMFPEDPEVAVAGLRQTLEPYGLDPEWLVCPSSPEPLAAHGLSYLWNTALNQTSLRDRKEITWVLVDIQALDNDIQGPHFGNVHILYTDGRIERSLQPPHSLPVQYD